MSDFYSNEQIVEKLLALLQHPSKSSLMRDLGVSKQSISQYARQQGIDINNKIITRLIDTLEDPQTKKTRQKRRGSG